MRRKLISQGGGGFTVYLPKKWIEKHGFKPGDDIEIEEKDSILEILGRKQVKREKTVTLRFEDDDWKGDERPEKYVQRMLAAAYKSGADTIVVKSNIPHILDYIERRVEGFIGIEIVDQEKNTLIIKSLVQGLEMEFDKVINRIVLLMSHISGEAYTAIKENDKSSLNNILRLEKTHNRMTDFAKRILSKRVPTEKDKYWYAFIMESERLVDEYKMILKNCKKNTSLSTETMQIFSSVNDYLQLLLRFFKKGENKDAKKLALEFVPLKEKISRLIEKDNTIIHYGLLSIIIKTYEMGEAMLEGGINASSSNKG